MASGYSSAVSYQFNFFSMNKEKGNAVVWVLVVVVVAIVVWLAYKQGYFAGLGAQPSQQPGVQINLPGSSSSPTPRGY